MTHEEELWRQEHDAYEQLRIVLNWCDYEDYDYIYRCGSMEKVLELFTFVNFDIGVEFVSSVQELIEEELEDGDTTTLDKARAWDKAHGMSIFTDLCEDAETDAEKETLRHRISAAAMDATEDSPYTIALNNEMVGIFHDPEARVWLKVEGRDEPIDFDALDIEDLRDIATAIYGN